MCPLNDRQGREGIWPQELRDEPRHEADNVTAFSGLLDSYEAKVRTSAPVLQVINFRHQEGVVFLELLDSSDTHVYIVLISPDTLL